LGRYHGVGTLMNDHGVKIYEGSFVSGKRDGEGQAFSDDGVPLYVGNFKNDRYEGVGTLLDADGTPVYKGYFRGGDMYLEGFLGLPHAKLQEILGPPDPPVGGGDAPPETDQAAAPITEAEPGSSDDAESIPASGSDGEAGTGTGGSDPADASADEAAGKEEVPGAASGQEAESEQETISDQTYGPIGTDATPARKAAENPAPQTPAEEAPEVETSEAEVPVVQPEADARPPDQLPGGPVQLVYGKTQISFELKPDEDNPEAYAVTEIRTWNRAVLDAVWAKLQASDSAGIREPLAEPNKYEITYLQDGCLLTLTFNKEVPVRLVISYASLE